MASANNVSDSEFSMWRALSAFTLVDNFLSLEEQDMLRSCFKNVKFSREQTETLKKDFTDPPDIQAMYKKITEHKDKERFCVLARALAWCDGDMDKQEEVILQHVGCMKGTADEEMLKNSRNHPDYLDYHQQYMKAGAMRFNRNYRLFEAHA